MTAEVFESDLGNEAPPTGVGTGNAYELPDSGETEKIELLGSVLGRPIPLAYGRHIVGGNVIFQEYIPETSAGAKDDKTVYFIALGEGQWDSMETLWINGQKEDVNDDSRIHFHPGMDGQLGTETAPGTFNQKICSFYPSAFSPRLTFSRIAYLALKLPHDAKAPDSSLDVRGIFKTSKVRTFDASGNQLSFAYSANPSWCILDLLIRRWIKPHGLSNEALTAAEKLKIDFQSFVDFANDSAVNPGDGAALFESHVAFVDQTDLGRALNQMLLVSRAYMIERNGKLAIFMDKVRSSQFTVDRDAILAQSLELPRKDLRELANLIKLKFRDLASGGSDSAKDFQVVTKEFDDPGHQDQIARIITSEIDLGNSTTGRAQRLGEYIRYRSLKLDDQAVLTLLQAGNGNNPIDLTPGDRILGPKDIDGWDTRDYEVLEITDEPDGSRDVFVQEYDEAAFSSALASQTTVFLTDIDKDPGNPSGASGLVLKTFADDSKIPPGTFVAEFSPDTVNVEALEGVMLVLSAALPAEGPYKAERDGFPAATVEFGTCTVVKDSRSIKVTRAANSIVLNRVLLVYTNDASPDTDLDGHIVVAEGLNSLTVDRPFEKNGTFAYAVVKRWWDVQGAESSNKLVQWFPIDQLEGGFETFPNATRRTPPIPYPNPTAGSYFATLYSRNKFGVGARITSIAKIFAEDSALPGAVIWSSMTAIRGEFLARWKDPSTGASSIDNFVIQYTNDSDPTWLNAITVPILLGKVYSKEGMDPNKKYRWRISAHNQSAISAGSNADLSTYLDGKGWGAWTYWDGGTGSAVQANAIGVSSFYDTALPDSVTSFNVTSTKGEFTARWANPSTGNITIIDFGIQYSPNSDFSSPIASVKLGKIYEKTGYDPNKKYYWRIAARNESGITSHASGPGAPGQPFAQELGWGPWTNFGAPTVVSSFIDTAVPGRLESLYLCGKNGDFYAKWSDPTTGGNLTLDKIAEQWSTDGATWQSGDANNPVHVFAYGHSARGTDPDKTYYFRFAAHNDSGLASDANGPGGAGQSLDGQTGWGPWTYYNGTACTTASSSLVSPGTAVSSGKLLVAIDTALPGAPNSVALSAAEGIFALTWAAPSTGGNKTIDGYLVQYATDSAFTQNKVTQLVQGFTFKLYDSNKTYFFRVSAHNQSGITGGDADQTQYLDQKGWGAWANSIPASAASGAGTGPLGNPNGTFTIVTLAGSFTKRVTVHSAPNTVNSDLELYWEYTQGSILATEFSIKLTDGTATFDYRVPAAPGFTLFRADIKRWVKSKSCTVTFTAIKTSDLGVYPGPILSPAAFATNATVAPSPDPVTGSTRVGQLDWAGGEVWFNTEQYRSNIPPTNGITTLSALSDLRDGANQAIVTINMPTYTQGTYIATHLAVLVRAGIGTISLTVDSIISLINVASIPTTYIIPFPFKASEQYSVALAAVALTEDGYSFHNTFAQTTFTKATNIDINGTSTQNILLTPASGKETRAAETFRVDGKYAFTEANLSLSGDANDVNVGGTPWTRASSSVASSTITGIANGVAGRFQVICNVGASNNVVLANENISSLAANRIITGTGANLTFAPSESVTLIYDGSSLRWRVVSRQP